MIGETNAFKVAAMVGPGRLPFLDSGPAAASLLIYGGERPATGASTSSSPLAVIDLSKPAGTVSAAGVLTLIVPQNLENNGLILISGTPTWARMLNGAGDVAFDADVGVEVILSQTQFFAGGTARLVSAVLG
jgi:hypothetical protein